MNDKMTNAREKNVFMARNTEQQVLDVKSKIYLFKLDLLKKNYAINKDGVGFK